MPRSILVHPRSLALSLIGIAGRAASAQGPHHQQQQPGAGGVQLVNQAGTSLTDIVDLIKTVARIVADIANASAEQSSGLDQINKALSQMDEVTQKDSALVEENAATAKTLERQAKAMDERVGFFQLDDDLADDAAPQAAAARAPTRPAAPKSVAKVAGGPVRQMRTALAAAVEEF
jgi:uncharacterized phage infection (PIP) family protein YhgE